MTRRLRLGLSVCAALLAVPVFGGVGAQNPASVSRGRLGIIGGINSAILDGPDAAKESRRTAALTGALAILPLDRHFGFQAELLFTMKGSKETQNGHSSTLRMNYVEVPLLVRFTFPVTGEVKPFLYAGGSVSFLVGCDVFGPDNDPPNVACEKFEEAFDFKFNSVDHGVIAGGGLAFDVSGRTFTVGARYSHGLADIANEGERRYRVLSILATVEFPFGK